MGSRFLQNPSQELVEEIAMVQPLVKKAFSELSSLEKDDEARFLYYAREKALTDEISLKEELEEAKLEVKLAHDKLSAGKAEAAEARHSSLRLALKLAFGKPGEEFFRSLDSVSDAKVTAMLEHLDAGKDLETIKKLLR